MVNLSFKRLVLGWIGEPDQSYQNVDKHTIFCDKKNTSVFRIWILFHLTNVLQAGAYFL